MKVLHVISSVNPSGGGPIEAIKQVGQVLDSQGHTNEVLCLDAADSPWLSKFPLKAYSIGPGTLKYAYSKYLVPWLREHAARYDVVLAHGLWQYSSFGTWLALHDLNIPYFVYTHGMLDPWFKRTYPFKHFKKWLYWPWAEYRVLRDAQAVIFTCEEERILARESFWLYKCNEVIVRYCVGSPPENAEEQRQTFMAQFPQLRNKRLLLFMSRIHVKKGCELLIEAFARVADTDDALHLVMAGPDQTGWQAELQKQAERLGIDRRVTWTGMLLNDLKWGAFNTAEVFVLPSHQENFGIVVPEAMACGVPVLISNKVNIWREIASDGAGLVANDDLESTVELLQKWLAMSPNEHQNMRQKAKQCFDERFEIHKTAQHLLEVFDSRGIR